MNRTSTCKIIARALLIVLFLPHIANATYNSVTAIDSEGRQVVLNSPAQRIVSLSPHITELLFAAGAGDRLVGVVEYSDYPNAATKIKSVGSAFKIDMEAILSIKPDLVVAWTSGNSSADITMIKNIGIPVFYSDPKYLKDIPIQIRNLALLTETKDVAEKAAKKFTNKYLALQARYSGKSSVSVFYQLWHQPIMTVNKNHLINDIIELCGGKNVFAALPSLTPVVGVEDVINAKPEFIIASSVAREDAVSTWKKWQTVKNNSPSKIITVPTDLLHRLGPRIIDAAEIMCRRLAAAK